SFQIKKRTDKKERDKEERPLGFGTLWGGPSTYVGAKGLIWIDKPTSVVRRIVFHYTDIDRDYPYVAIADSTNYTLVPIAGLGNFVLPVAGENLSCDRDGFCWRDVYSFSNCRKFAAQSRILPAQGGSASLELSAECSLNDSCPLRLPDLNPLIAAASFLPDNC